jgi:hypothetical protein
MTERREPPMRAVIHVQPATGRRREFAAWAVRQLPKIRTSSEVAFAVPAVAFPDVPEELLHGAVIDGQPYVGAADDPQAQAQAQALASGATTALVGEGVGAEFPVPPTGLPAAAGTSGRGVGAPAGHISIVESGDADADADAKRVASMAGPPPGENAGSGGPVVERVIVGESGPQVDVPMEHPEGAPQVAQDSGAAGAAGSEAAGPAADTAHGCDQCDRAFTSGRALKAHARSHRNSGGTSAR